MDKKLTIQLSNHSSIEAVFSEEKAEELISNLKHNVHSQVENKGQNQVVHIFPAHVVAIIEEDTNERLV